MDKKEIRKMVQEYRNKAKKIECEIEQYLSDILENNFSEKKENIVNTLKPLYAELNKYRNRVDKLIDGDVYFHYNPETK
jgi:uncharacterized coiled-coil DUF342 family protein